jgi:hypothetical protein
VPREEGEICSDDSVGESDVIRVSGVVEEILDDSEAEDSAAFPTVLEMSPTWTAGDSGESSEEDGLRLSTASSDGTGEIGYSDEVDPRPIVVFASNVGWKEHRTTGVDLKTFQLDGPPSCLDRLSSGPSRRGLVGSGAGRRKAFDHRVASSSVLCWATGGQWGGDREEG